MKQASITASLGSLLQPRAVAGLLLFGLVLGNCTFCLEAAQAQLPPVNMGKFVHQPGDNQYSNGTQDERHGSNAPAYQVVNPNPQQMQGPAGWTPARRKGGDISLEPIVCDEPIPIAGFPPIPDTLDLPGIRNGGSFTSAGSGGAGGMRGGSYGGGGGTSPGLGMPPPENHQGYGSYQPGYFKKGSTTGKGAEMYSSGDGASKSSGGGGGGGGGASASQKQLGRMGKEPSLDKNSGDAAPEAPQALQVNQATTQDLSLPDDDADNSGNKKSSNQVGRAVQRMQRRLGSQLMRPLYSMPIQMPTFK